MLVLPPNCDLHVHDVRLVLNLKFYMQVKCANLYHKRWLLIYMQVFLRVWYTCLHQCISFCAHFNHRDLSINFLFVIFQELLDMATYKPENILITGAAGFIASHVVNRLIRNHPSYKIVVFDKLDYCSNEKNLNISLVLFFSALYKIEAILSFEKFTI